MNRLWELRKKAGRSQETTAQLLGKHTTTYKRWEEGIHDLKLSEAKQIAELYNVSLDYLAGLIDEPRKLK